MTITGLKPVWGVPAEIKPLVGAPAGRVRYKFRNKSVGRVFIKDENGIRCFYLEDCGDVWKPSIEIGRNANG